jgi:hypothetical protein
MGSPLLLSLFPDAWVISDITISLAMSYFQTNAVYAEFDQTI